LTKGDSIIGVSSVILDELDGAQGFATLNTKIVNINDVIPSYLSWYYNSDQNIKYAKKMSTGDGRSNYNLKDFNKAIIPIPCPQEQTKIANLLSAIDDDIELGEQELEQLQLQKKGLMQGMFV
jgi:type I restriction enzyme S subunit